MLFVPEPRAAGRQRFCPLLACQKVRQQQAKQRWLLKTGNVDYHCGQEPLRRVREWRRDHPGYWRRKKVVACKPHTVTRVLAVLDEFALRNACGALQNACPPQLIGMLGMMARFQGHALQNDIVAEIRANMMAGYVLLGIPFPRSKSPDSPCD